MKIISRQITLELKLFFREPISVFWTFFFPVIIMVCIGWFFNDPDNSLKIYYFDEDSSISSKKMISITKEENTNILFKKLDALEFQRLKKKNRGEFLLKIPKGFHLSIKKNQVATIELYYNLAYGSNSELFFSKIYQSIPKINSSIASQENILNVNKTNLGIKGIAKLRYIDFLSPGIIAMSVMSTCFFGVGIGITAQREKGQLRRLALTPVNKSKFILAYIFFRYIIVLLQAILLIATGYLLFKVQFYGDIFSLIFVLTVGLLSFISIGYLIASQSKKTEVTAAIANLLFFPMLLLGGVYFPVDNVPEILKPLVNILPLYHLTESLRQVINYGEPFYNLLHHQWMQLGIFVVCFIVTVKLFKWE